MTSRQREHLASGWFGLPRQRKYPIPDAAHARNALARAARFATPAEQAEIRANIRRLYPGLEQTLANK